MADFVFKLRQSGYRLCALSHDTILLLSKFYWVNLTNKKALFKLLGFISPNSFRGGIDIRSFLF